MTIIYHEKDANPLILSGKTIGVLGYNKLARSFALNMRDSGVMVIVGCDENEQANARIDGFDSKSISTVTKQADVIMLLLPDELVTNVYMESISPGLRRDHTLIFASAYSIAFGFIEPPPFVDVGLVAPRSAGDTMRKNYQEGKGFLSFVAVGQDASHGAWDTVLATAHAIGSLKFGAVEVSMEQEAELSLFVQQAVLPALHHIIVASARLLMQQGYPPEAALQDLYLSGKFSDYMQQVASNGLLHALQQTTLTGQYGIFSRVDRFNELKLERLMEVALDEIRAGEFAQEWAQEYADNHPRLDKLRRQQESLDLWELEQQTLEFFESDEK